MKATEKQINLLRIYGILTPPRTKAGCSRLIDFIKEGNGAKTGPESTESERIALFLATQKLFEGKKAMKRGYDTVATIKGVLPKSRREVRDAKSACVLNGINPAMASPFKVTYAYEGSTAVSNSSLSSFSLVG